MGSKREIGLKCTRKKETEVTCKRDRERNCRERKRTTAENKRKRNCRK